MLLVKKKQRDLPDKVVSVCGKYGRAVKLVSLMIYKCFEDEGRYSVAAKLCSKLFLQLVQDKKT